MDVSKNIAEFMSALGKKNYKRLDVSIIRNAIKLENHRRKAAGIFIYGKTSDGKLEINNRVAAVANEIVGHKRYSAEDVRCFRRAREIEFQDRTGKCAWGYAYTRERMGYDPVTGLEAI